LANKDNVSVPRALLEELLEYTERFADQNDEPKDGSCRTAISQTTEILASTEAGK
jgi:hypothetical protein